MFRKILFASLFMLSFSRIFSQEINITLIDIETSKPVESAEIYFPELNKTSLSDKNGNYTLEDAPSGDIKLIVNSMGYNTYTGFVNPKKNTNEVKLEKSHFALKEVIVSVPTGKLQTENIVSIEHKKLVELQSNSPLTLAATISNLPGVYQNSTGSGIGKPVIRGLSGNRIVTYTQGIRLENQQWGAEHGLGVGDIGIDGVEVIKGPASLLYGADALGGVLYFNDAKYAKQNTTEVFIESRLMSNGLTAQNNVGFKVNYNNLSANVFVASNSSADYTVPGGSNVFNTRFDEKNIKASIGYSKNNWISNLRYSYLKNNFGITEEDSLYTSKALRTFELPFQTIINNNLSFENTLFIKESKLNLILGYTSNAREEFEDFIEEPALSMDLKTSTFNLKWYSPSYNDKWSLVIGSQGMHQTNKNKGEEVLIPDATTNDIGVFSLINYKLNSLSLQGGLRVDNRSIISSPFTDEDNNEVFPNFNKSYLGFNYSAGGAYTLNNSIFRVNLSSGFRAPNTTELLANGEHEGSGQYLQGNKNLESENANQIDVEYSYSDKHFEFSVNPFVNVINNYIYLNPTNREIGNVPVFEYEQIGATLYGGEMGFHYHPHQIHFLHISSNISTVLAEDNNGNALPLIPQTRINSTLSVTFNHKGKFRIKNIYYQNIYNFKQNKVSVFETESPAYDLSNIGAEFSIASNSFPIDIKLGVKNLLNQTYIDHLSRFKDLGIPNQGINFYASIKFNFESNI